MPPKKRVRKEVSSEEGSTYESDSPSVEEILDSDDLDATPPPSSQILKRTKKAVNGKKSPEKKSPSKPKEKTKPAKANGSPKKKETAASKKRKREGSDDEDEEEGGIEVVGKIVQAPTTGKVPPGRISHNTFNFLQQLKKTENNDREWFKLHEPVYRQAEKEWGDFVEEFTSILTEVDDEVPHLPPKDVIHRIYRDVRFSNDKTPYKTNFSASFSRTGRKGIFAHYHISVSPGGKSIMAAGLWCPGKNELESIRTQIRRNPTQLRDVISEPTFESLFGPAKWSKDKRQNIFGGEDQLKVAPKGVPKDHPDIDLLKCRSYAVVHHFTDEQVLSPDFKEIMRIVAEGARPFVHQLNHMITIQDEDEEEDAES